MKKFKYKLEGLLKIRKAREEGCKMELGQLQNYLSKCRYQIQVENEGIHAAQSAHNKMLESGIGGREVQFFPRFIEGKEVNIQLLKKEIKRYEALVSEKLKELNLLRAEVKVIDNLKEKAQAKFKKEEDKKEELKREENILIWQNFNKQRF